MQRPVLVWIPTAWYARAASHTQPSWRKSEIGRPLAAAAAGDSGDWKNVRPFGNAGRLWLNASPLLLRPVSRPRSTRHAAFRVSKGSPLAVLFSRCRSRARAHSSSPCSLRPSRRAATYCVKVVAGSGSLTWALRGLLGLVAGLQESFPALAGPMNLLRGRSPRRPGSRGKLRRGTSSTSGVCSVSSLPMLSIRSAAVRCATTREFSKHWEMAYSHVVWKR
mmetsp:Transcript_98809/g.318668  ORF Transcript_98809/g.318668 Transcript_98809/m.318668 type:complete len:221 (-) Transcript_98809:932-1594(-)